MTDETVTQLGLTAVYLAVASLMGLLQRVEKSPPIRYWTFAFLLLGVDAGISAARSAFELPTITRVIAWCALAGGSFIGLIGTRKFLGRGFSRGVYVLGGALVVVLAGGMLLNVSVDAIRPIIFTLVGAAFAWGGVSAVRARIPGGAGGWVAGSGFIATGLYAVMWPTVRTSFLMPRMEFFFDLVVLLWVANGLLLMHFDRARQRIRDLAKNELALREKLAQAEKLEALGRLAAGVAHDINNVLTIIINGSDLVLRQIEDRPKAADRLKMVRQAAEGAVSFTKQLLALGRRRLPGRRSTLLQDAVDGAMRIIRPSQTPDIALTVAPIPKGAAVNAAEGQIEQLLVNLVVNARDAMPTGGRLTVQSEEVKNESKVRIIIADTGCGMDEATLSHIFDPFFTTKDANTGTGLGLAAVYAIVQQLGGDISVSSTVDKGTTFTIALPACAPPPLPEATCPDTFSPGDIRVLVVDDHEHVTQTVTDGLLAVGFKAEGLCNPKEALRKADADPPDVLLTDVCMPEMEGPTLAAEIRTRHPKVRVIFMSGIAQEPDADMDGDGSVQDAIRLVKPVTVEHLTATIRSLMA